MKSREWFISISYSI